MKQALIWIDAPISSQHWYSQDADAVAGTSLWQIHVVAGRLCKAEEAVLNSSAIMQAWEENAMILRRIVAYLVGEQSLSYLYRPYLEEESIPNVDAWQPQDLWVAPPSAFLSNELFKRVITPALINEKWWPSETTAGSAILTFDSSKQSAYERSLQDSLDNNNFELSRQLVTAPRRDFSLLTDLMETAVLYVYAGGFSKTAPAMWLFFPSSKQIECVIPIVLNEFESAGFNVLQTKDYNAFINWYKQCPLQKLYPS